MQPQPGRLQAGVATVLVDVPVGAPHGGYSRRKPADEPGSTWANQFPATRGVHTDATARALAFTDGLTRTALVRLDVCLVTPSLRARIRKKLDDANERTSFIVQATHTHGQMARFFEPVRIAVSNGFDIIANGMDTYDPEIDDRLASAAAAAILEAFAHLEPASVGAASIDAGMLNGDRRCDNDPVYGAGFRDTTMSIVRVDRVDETGTPVKPLAAIMHFAAHGTILERGNTLLTTDAPGAMELAASDALGVPVIFSQGGAGDVAPSGSPLRFEATQRLEWLGAGAASLARQAFDRARPPKAPERARLLHVDRGVPIGREALGYQKGEFPEYGGVSCAVGGGQCGSILTSTEKAGAECMPIERRPTPRFAMSLVQLEDVAMVSLPGEPSSALSLKVAAALEPLGTSTRLALGYSNDHYGYLLEQDDFLRGGYEAQVSPFGWRLGGYLVDQAGALAQSRAQPQEKETSPAVVPFTPRAATESEAAPAIVTEVADVQRTQTAVFVFTGGDPTLGNPSVALEREENGAFTQVMASPTRPLINGPEIIRRYAATPNFDRQPQATKRTHQWTAQWEVLPQFPMGTYRFVATGRAKLGATVSTYTLRSRVFSVSASTSITALSARLLSDGRVVLSARYLPNPTRFEPDDNPSANLRMWDERSSPTMGMLARGDLLQFSVGQASGPSTPLSATWSEAESGFVSALPTGLTGSVVFSVEPRAFTDRLGNTNGSALSATLTR